MLTAQHQKMVHSRKFLGKSMADETKNILTSVRNVIKERETNTNSAMLDRLDTMAASVRKIESSIFMIKEETIVKKSLRKMKPVFNLLQEVVNVTKTLVRIYSYLCDFACISSI